MFCLSVAIETLDDSISETSVWLHSSSSLLVTVSFSMVAKIPCHILPISIATTQKEVSINAETLTTFSFIALQQT